MMHLSMQKGKKLYLFSTGIVSPYVFIAFKQLDFHHEIDHSSIKYGIFQCLGVMIDSSLMNFSFSNGCDLHHQ